MTDSGAFFVTQLSATQLLLLLLLLLPLF